MIYTEDGSFVFDNELDTAIPFTIRENASGSVDYEVYEELYDFAERFAEKFRNCEFSENALDEIWTTVNPYAAEHGYAPPHKKHRCWYHRYIFDEICEIRTNKILASTLLISAEISLTYKNRTTYDFDPELSAGDSAVSIIGGEIVSVCAINSSSEDENYPELCVETIPEMRGRGYAVSNICAMTKGLREEGLGAEYRCSQKNIASARAASAAGFRAAGRLYYFVCYKKEKLNGI